MATRSQTRRALRWLPLAVLVGLAACSSEKGAKKPPAQKAPVEAARQEAWAWSPRYDVTRELTPWEELPRVPPSSLRGPKRSARERRFRDPRDVAVSALDGPAIEGCTIEYREWTRPAPVALYPDVGARFVLACAEDTRTIARGTCVDGLAASRSASSARAAQDVSAVETAASVTGLDVGAGLFIAAARAGGIEPRALLVELGKRSPRPECWTQAADLPLIGHLDIALQRDYLRSRPGDALLQRRDKLRTRRRMWGGQLGPELQRELDLLEKELREEPELRAGSEDKLERWREVRDLVVELRDAHVEWLRAHGRAPTARELREAVVARGRAAKLVERLPSRDGHRALIASYLDLEVRSTSPWVRARLDGEPGYLPIVGPTVFPDDDDGRRPDRAEEPVCGACRDSRDCRDGLLCSADLTDELEGHCTRLVDTLALERTPRPGRCDPVEEVGPGLLPLAFAQPRARGGYLCEPAGGCRATAASARPGARLRDAATYGGLIGDELRFFGLDAEARCVLAVAEKPLRDGRVPPSALPVFKARSLSTSLSCEGQPFAPLFSQMCRVDKPGYTSGLASTPLVPIELAPSKLRFAPLEDVSRVYGETLVAARARVTRASDEPVCFEGLWRSVLDVVRDVQEQDTRSVGPPDEPVRWPRYAGWMSEEHFWAIAKGEGDDADYEMESGPHYVRPDELDEVAPEARGAYEAYFAERARNVSFLKRALGGEVEAWTGEREADAARAAMLLAIAPRIDAPDRLEESAAKLRRWAEHVDAESRAALQYALEVRRSMAPAERAAVTRLLPVVVGYVPSEAVGLEPYPLSMRALLCDLGRRWADDEAWTGQRFVGESPHWYHRATWEELARTADELGLPALSEASEAQAVCEARFAAEVRPLSDGEKARFGALEARRLGARDLSTEERVTLDALGSRFTLTVSDEATRVAERDALVRAHARAAPLLDEERTRLLTLHKRRSYGNVLHHDDAEDYPVLRFRFLITSDTSLDDALLASLRPAERRAHVATLACVAQHKAARATADEITVALSRRRVDNEGYPETLADLGALPGADRERFELVLEERGRVRLVPTRGSDIDPRAAWVVDDWSRFEFVGDERARCAEVFRAATSSFDEVE